MHLQAGQQVWLVSATPVQLAQVIARELGFTGRSAQWRKFKMASSPVAWSVTSCTVGKKYAVAALAEREGLDLTRCTAYSDSINDIPLLSMVGTAVTVNPDSGLRAEAKSAVGRCGITDAASVPGNVFATARLRPNRVRSMLASARAKKPATFATAGGNGVPREHSLEKRKIRPPHGGEAGRIRVKRQNVCPESLIFML